MVMVVLLSLKINCEADLDMCQAGLANVSQHEALVSQCGTLSLQKAVMAPGPAQCHVQGWV